MRTVTIVLHLIISWLWEGANAFAPLPQIQATTTSSSKKKARSFPFLLSSSFQNENEEDDSLDIANPRELEQALRFVSKTQHPNRRQASSSSSSSLTREAWETLQDLANQEDYNNNDPSYENNNNNSNIFEDDNDEDDLDGVFLSGDDYLASSRNILPDGSLAKLPSSSTKNQRPFPEELLRQLTMPPKGPTPNEYDYGDYNDDASISSPTLTDLLKAQDRRDAILSSSSSSSMNKKNATTIPSQEIHRQIFEQEQTFLEQSNSLFTRGLTNKTAAQEALAWRRSANYRKQQAQDVAQLEASIAEWEQELERQEEKRKQNRQRGGGGGDGTKEGGDVGSLTNPPDATDIASFQQEEEDDGDDANNSDDEEEEDQWELVDDPSTDGQFYWNHRTGEMKWEL